MPRDLHRYQRAGDGHFITFSCCQRRPVLSRPQDCDLSVEVLEETRAKFAFVVMGYVVMPEHVHLLISEPEHGSLAVALQMLKQNSRNQKPETRNEKRETRN